MSPVQGKYQVTDPDEQGGTRIGVTGKRLILISLFLLAKVDYFGGLAIPITVDLIQLFIFKFYQLKFKF